MENIITHTKHPMEDLAFLDSMTTTKNIQWILIEQISEIKSRLNNSTKEDEQLLLQGIINENLKTAKIKIVETEQPK